MSADKRERTPTDDLIDVLRKKKDEISRVDWAARRSEWLESVKGFMTQAREWLRPLTEQELLTVDPQTVRLSENLLGEYEAAALQISTPDGIRVGVVPVARLIIGGTGRIDIRSGPRSDNLIRTAETGSEFNWLRSRQPVTLVPLDEGLFTTIILQMVR